MVHQPHGGPTAGGNGGREIRIRITAFQTRSGAKRQQSFIPHHQLRLSLQLHPSLLPPQSFISFLLLVLQTYCKLFVFKIAFTILLLTLMQKSQPPISKLRKLAFCHFRKRVAKIKPHFIQLLIYLCCMRVLFAAVH